MQSQFRSGSGLGVGLETQAASYQGGLRDEAVRYDLRQVLAASARRFLRCTVGARVVRSSSWIRRLRCCRVPIDGLKTAGCRSSCHTAACV